MGVAGKMTRDPVGTVGLGLVIALQCLRKVLELCHARARAVFEPLVFPEMRIGTAQRMPLGAQSRQNGLQALQHEWLFFAELRPVPCIVLRPESVNGERKLLIDIPQ